MRAACAPADALHVAQMQSPPALSADD